MQNNNTQNVQEALICRTQLQGTAQFLCCRRFNRNSSEGEILSHDEDDASGSMHKIEQQSLNTVKAENYEQYPLQLRQKPSPAAILVPWFETMMQGLLFYHCF